MSVYLFYLERNIEPETVRGERGMCKLLVPFISWTVLKGGRDACTVSSRDNSNIFRRKYLLGVSDSFLKIKLNVD